MIYHFLHNDGRHGEGETVWRAVVAALGVAAAQAMPQLEDPLWSYDTEFGWRIAIIEEAAHGDPLGVMFETSSGWFAPQPCECEPPAWCPACDNFTEEERR